MKHRGLRLLMWKHCLQVFLIPFAVFTIFKAAFHFTPVFIDSSLWHVVAVGVFVAVPLILAVSITSSLPLVFAGMVLAVIAITAPLLYVSMNGHPNYWAESGIYAIAFGMIWGLTLQPRVYLAGYNALDMYEMGGNLPEGYLSGRFRQR